MRKIEIGRVVGTFGLLVALSVTTSGCKLFGKSKGSSPSAAAAAGGAPDDTGAGSGTTDSVVQILCQKGSIHDSSWNKGLSMIGISCASGNADEQISNLVNFNGSACWKGLTGDTSSMGSFKVYCEVNGVAKQISDINPGQDDHPQSLTVTSDSLYFVASTVNGQKIFRYDGKAVTPTPEVSVGGDDQPGNLVWDGKNTLYFSANNGTSGIKLYSLVGQTLTQISNTNSNGGDNIQFINWIAGSLFFSSYDGMGYRLFNYDGSTVTQISSDNPSNDSPTSLAASGSTLYFRAIDENQTWKIYQYSNKKTSKIIPDYSPNSFLPISGGIYYVFNDNIYSFDGTSSTKITNVSSNSFQQFGNLTLYQGTLFFTASPYSNKDKKVPAFNQIMKYDGTTISSVSSFTYTPSPNAKKDSPGIFSLAVVNDKLFFKLSLDLVMGSIYQYDGTQFKQIAQVGNIGKDEKKDNTKALVTPIGNKLYFSANLGNGIKLYKYDGTSVLLVSPTGTGGDDGIGQMVAIGNVLYFSAWNGSGSKLFKKENGVVSQITNIVPSGDDRIDYLVSMGNVLYFTARDANNFGKLYQYTGGVASIVGEINTGADDNPHNLATNGSILYFGANDGSGDFLFQLKDGAISKVSSVGHNLYWITPVGDYVYYGAYTDNWLMKTFQYDGTNAVMIPETNPGTEDEAQSNVVRINGKVYFISMNSAWSYELYSFDGTNTTQIPINKTGSSSVNYLTQVGTSLYFSANDGTGNYLFSYDGTNLAKIPLGDGVGNPYLLTAHGSSLYFAANANGGNKVFQYDGKTVTQLFDANPGSNDNPQWIYFAGDRPYFSLSNSQQTGNKVFTFDGKNVTQISDIVKGLDDGPSVPVAVGTSIDFSGQVRNITRLFEYTP